jgi:hypothetical protein
VTTNTRLQIGLNSPPFPFSPRLGSFPANIATIYRYSSPENAAPEKTEWRKRLDSLSPDHVSRLESARYCDSSAKTHGFCGSSYVLNYKGLRRSVSIKMIEVLQSAGTKRDTYGEK